jgi:hypothetical protein
MRFILACLAFFVMLAVSSFYSLADYTYHLGGLTWDQSKQVVWEVLQDAPRWKVALSLLTLFAISYAGVAWIFAPFAKKKQ